MGKRPGRNAAKSSLDSNRDWRACNGEMRIKIHLEVLGSAEVDDISNMDSGAVVFSSLPLENLVLIYTQGNLLFIAKELTGCQDGY